MSQNEVYITWILLGIVIYGLIHVSKQIDYANKKLQEMEARDNPRTPIEYEY